jgi:Periplasmic binding protein
MPTLSTRSLVTLAALASLGMSGNAFAEPVKVALIETLSGPASLTGKMNQTAVKFALAKLAEDKVWPDGIQLMEYDNQSGPSEAADKLKAAINDGAHIVIQGASSAIAGQITGDVQKHNARNPGREVLFINIGAEAMELTGTRCHFYHFRWNTYGESRMKAMFSAAKEAGGLGKKVYYIGQNYSWGQDVQKLTGDYANQFGYTVVGSVLHDVNKIQDFAPYIAKCRYRRHGQLGQRPAAADQGGRGLRLQGPLPHHGARPDGQHRRGRRHRHRALHRPALLRRCQRRQERVVRRVLQDQDRTVPVERAGQHRQRRAGPG